MFAGLTSCETATSNRRPVGRMAMRRAALYSLLSCIFISVFIVYN